MIGGGGGGQGGWVYTIPFTARSRNPKTRIRRIKIIVSKMIYAHTRLFAISGRIRQGDEGVVVVVAVAVRGGGGGGCNGGGVFVCACVRLDG